MNEIFARYLADSIEESISDNGFMMCVENLTQAEVKNELLVERSDFRMLSFETTDDNPMDVDFNESKFLNDDTYSKYWVRISNGESISFACVKNHGKDLVIEAIEVGRNHKGCGYGRIIVEGIEMFGRDYDFENIIVQPFDTTAGEFWEHMGYTWTRNYSLIKKIK